MKRHRGRDGKRIINHRPSKENLSKRNGEKERAKCEKKDHRRRVRNQSGKVWTSGERRGEIRADEDAVRSQGQSQGQLSE